MNLQQLKSAVFDAIENMEDESLPEIFKNAYDLPLEQKLAPFVNKGFTQDDINEMIWEHPSMNLFKKINELAVSDAYVQLNILVNKMYENIDDYLEAEIQ